MTSLFGWGSDPFGELVEKATSELLPAGQEDIALNLEICDQVRAKQVQPKPAMQAIKRRISHKNPNVVLLALGLTDICIKNGGDHFIAEVASREFMDNLVMVLQSPSGVNADVKSKMLKLIQNWAQITESKPQMSYINETYKSLKTARFEFPPKDRSLGGGAAFAETMTAPEWVDSEVCMRCRTAFTTFNRKHHCRNCGQVFCNDCSSKQMALPWYGIGQDTRVCEACFSKKAPAKTAPIASSEPSRSPSYKSSVRKSGSVSSTKRASGSSSRKRKEEDELALAIKLSLETSGGAGPSRPGFVASSQPVKEGRPTRQADGRMMEGTDADDDPELAAAIAASLREYAPPAPSAPLDDGQQTPRLADGRYGSGGPNTMYGAQQESRLPLPPSLDLPASDVDALLTFSQEAARQEAYARQYGQWQASSGAIQQTQAAYERATGSRPRMAKTLDEATRRQGVLNSMHDKLSEAVRLYDRLLDAQMQRPAYGAYGQPAPVEGYGMYAPPQQSQPPQWSPQQYHRAADTRHASAPSAAPQAPPPAQEMYPSLPSQQQQPQLTGASQNYHHQQQYSSNDSYQAPESPSPYPYHQQTQNAAMYAQVAQAPPQNQIYGNDMEPQYAAQGYGAPQYVEPNHWQQQQSHPQMSPDAPHRDPGVIGPPSSQSMPQHHSQQPLHEAMAAVALDGPDGQMQQQQQQGMLPPPVESYESEGWLSNPSTQASDPASLRRQQPSSLDAAMPQSGYTQPPPAANAPTHEQQLAALPSTAKMPVTSPKALNGSIGSPMAASAPFAMPPPPPQGLPGLTSPGQQHTDKAWTRPVETPLIDL